MQVGGWEVGVRTGARVTKGGGAEEGGAEEGGTEEGGTKQGGGKGGGGGGGGVKMEGGGVALGAEGRRTQKGE